MADPRVMYGVTIHDAIRRGDPGEMRQLLGDARQTLIEAGDLNFAVMELQNALRGWRPPGYVFYGVVVHDAIKRGNPAEIETLLTDARAQLKEQGDLNAAIRDLEGALKKAKK